MERQQEIDQQFGFLIVLLLIVLTGYLFVQHDNRQPATPEQLQSIIHDTPCAAETFRMALQANTGTSSMLLTFSDAKKMASECKDKEEVKAVREKQLNALNAMSK
ncbi:hypothetical protein [Klebsiella variicola]|uniref:hypothetical protein n=1 Tax=Klebsiella variicola TaxID=244366 RepID=UPI001D0D970E|nr:hypothetical protein [Klebsiella variicola]